MKQIVIFISGETIVEAVIKDGMERMRLLDDALMTEQKRYSTEMRAKLASITIPDEIKSALAEIDAKRAALLAEQQTHDAEMFEKIKQAKAKLQGEIEAQTHAVYEDLANRKTEIEAEFIGAANAVDENIRKLENEIKTDTERLGKTVKGKYFMAVYNKGRITWNTAMMEAWINDHPFLKQARKESLPSACVTYNEASRLTQRAPDGWDSARFWGLVLSFGSLPFTELVLPSRR